MTNFTVELLLCAVVLGGAYILFGQQYLSGESTNKASSKKKKRSKSNKKGKNDAGASHAVNTVNENTKQNINGSGAATSAGARANNADKIKKTTSTNAKERLPSIGKYGDKSKQNGVSSHSSGSEEVDEDFPPLQATVPSSTVSNGRKANRSSTNGSSKQEQKPLAERLAKPRPITAVDDMVEKDDPLQGEKTFSRTMRIVKPDEKQSMLLDEGWPDDDEENAGDYYAPPADKEEAWQSVPIAKKSSTIRIASSHPQNGSASSSGSAARTVPGLPELTKKQRQNARKAELAKIAKEQAEQERLQRLAAHKRTLEGERMTEQYKQKVKQQHQQQAKLPKRQEVGGGMQAAVHDGKLIWE